MKILNLYAGIGGNRKLWKDVEVTAVEMNPQIAKIYQDFFPNDEVIIGDAHQFLLDHFKEYDFIWASPPCPTHSDIRRAAIQGGKYEGYLYPDMTLYQEIILLKHFAKGLWCIENVKPYYTPLIPTPIELHRHLFWTNFSIPNYKVIDERIHNDIAGSSTVYGFNLNHLGRVSDKRKMLRNLVNPGVALHILNAARNTYPDIQEGLFATLSDKPTDTEG